jgi:hypothetical protein
MQNSTRKFIFILLAIVLVALIAVWWYSGFSLDFMRFFAAELTPSPSPQASPAPGTPVICIPNSQAVNVGQQTTLNASAGAGSYTWYAPQGSPDTGTGSSFSVSYPTSGIKKITVEGPRGDGQGTIDSVVCTVIVNP